VPPWTEHGTRGRREGWGRRVLGWLVRVGPSRKEGERERERARAQVGHESARVSGWAERGKEKESPARVTDFFVFLFQKCEIVLVFVYFSGIFVKLQKY
jgi:hypothetical protein